MKLYRLCLIAIPISLTILAVSAGCSLAPAEVAPGITQSKASGSAEAVVMNNLGLMVHANETIKSFASLAAQRDIDGLRKLLILPVGADEENVRANLAKDIIPFFSDFEKIPGPKAANPATFSYLDNREGLNYYLFAMSKTGTRKPFIIGLVDEGRRALVAHIDVGHCIRGKHYDCPK